MLYMCWCTCAAARGGVLWVIRPPFPLTSADGRIRPSCQLLSPASPNSAPSSAAFWGGERGAEGGEELRALGRTQGSPGTSPAPRAGFDLHGPNLPPFSTSLVLPFLLQENKTSVASLPQSLGWGNAVPAAAALESQGRAVPPGKLPEKSRPSWHRIQHAQRRLDLLLTVLIV